MFIAYKIQSNIKPKPLESLNNGIWYYNFNITSEVINTVDMEMRPVEQTIYKFVQVRINGVPTISKCFDAILKSYEDENKTTLYDVLLSEGSNDQIEDIKYMIKVDFGKAEEKSPLDIAKEKVIREIDNYDTSIEVNSFKLNGISVWLDKDTRVGLMNSINIEKAVGKSESTLWLNGIKLVVNCDAAIKMLSALELYALNCFNKTAEHKKSVNSLTKVNEVQKYNYKTGYPEKLDFKI